MAALLTFTLLGEAIAFFHMEQEMSLEVEKDTEEEKKEDRLLACVVSTVPICTTEYTHLTTPFDRHGLMLWATPALESNTPPPKFI